MHADSKPEPGAPRYGAIEFELIELDDARRAHDALPEGVDKLPELAPDYWEQRRRKPVPSDRALQGTTIDWLLELHVRMRPRELCDRYPRAANALAAAWRNGEFAAVLDDMLIDRRGRRRGFPPEVRAELEKLRRACADPTGA